jgi:hypothetical protein
MSFITPKINIVNNKNEENMTISKLKAKKPLEVKPTKPKILVFGKAGIGKTWVALDFPSVYYIDTEGGATQPQYQNKLLKAGGVYLGKEDGSQSFNDIIEQVRALATEQHNYKTLVIDSISKIINLEIAEAESKKKDITVSDFGASKKPANQYFRQLLKWIEKLDMNVILIAHEKALWKKGEQVGETFDGADKLDYELDLSLQITSNGLNRRAVVIKSRIETFSPASVFEWNYETFAEKYGKSVIESKGNLFVPAKPEQITEANNLLDVVKLPEDEIEKWLKKNNADSFEEVAEDKMAILINYLKTKLNNLTKTKE